MFDKEILIVEFPSINWYAACAIMIGDVPALDHKIRNNPMKDWVVIRDMLLILLHSFCADLKEILCSLRNLIEKKL